MSMGTATAASGLATPSGISATAAGAAGVTAGTAGVAVAPAFHGSKCRTHFGTPVQDGIFSSEWSGFDVAGAADISCPTRRAKRTFNTVTVQGTYGDPVSSQFDVTVYGNDPSGTLNEPDLNNVVCATQRVLGTPTGAQYPAFDTTVITLANICRANPGTNWIEVQGVTTQQPWYWRTQVETGGLYEADWRDTVGFGTACSPGYSDDLYMQTCVFGGDVGEKDFMVELSKV